ncbi:hypothetical protein Rhopal_004410-T1 [Rhodotorula paludigena]|uniref:Chitin deacetylase n=1 Tax=Rhodotorula paludigena TaxID=86838 RepID=A0AAV5GLM7_9BASI|nr:hypothetical protein Rhopal_004410-T1 [Rhodotorula paludigena]
MSVRRSNWVTLGMDAIRKNYQGILNKQAAGKYNASGVIVLSHELNNGTMALSEEFLPQIRKQFTGGVVPVAVCLNNTQPYAETSAYTYPNYAQYVAGTHSVSLAAPTAAGAASETLATASGSYGAQTGAPASASSTGTSSSMLTQVASAASAQSSTSASGATAVAQHNTSGATSLSTLGGLAAMVAGALAGAAALA